MSKFEDVLNGKDKWLCGAEAFTPCPRDINNCPFRCNLKKLADLTAKIFKDREGNEKS